MENSFSFLAVTALSIGVFHTLAGPDHYLPFVVLSKSRSWSMVKTINIVIICGLGHVLSSVALGFLGIGIGKLISEITWIESVRGNIAAWLLLLFGMGYLAWALYRLLIRKSHHTHKSVSDKGMLTFWILFTIFVFGPCEPLIPMLMYPAAESNYLAVMGVAAIFAVATIGTMLISVILLLKGISLVQMHILERYQHVLAGAAVSLCGVGILFLGL